MIGHRVAQALATIGPDQSHRAPQYRAPAARRVVARMTADQPRLAPPQPHKPTNTHLAGSVALSLLGGRVIR